MRRGRGLKCIPLPRSLSLRPRLFLFVILFQVFLVLLSLLYLGGYHLDAYMFLSYLTRPLWDTPAPPFTQIQHFYAEGIDQKTLCELHGWQQNNKTNKVIDAIIFSNELDLLEIRLRELYPVVDKFFIVESDKTFTYKPKTLEFHNNRERYAFAADKIVYGLFKTPSGVTEKQAKSFYLESSMRGFMTSLLESNGVDSGDVVIVADVDEMPSRHTSML
jgi:beta-1,4-mannosyl-glycoprotein beta-1,4-N-acetylglucosaminyltransferase